MLIRRPYTFHLNRGTICNILMNLTFDWQKKILFQHFNVLSEIETPLPSTSTASTSQVVLQQITDTNASLSQKLSKMQKKITKLRKRNSYLSKAITSTSDRSTLENISRNEFIMLCRQFLPAKIFNFVESQILYDRSKRFNRYLKDVALRIHYKSPAAYRELQKIIFMPSIRTLQRITTKAPSTEGLHPQLLESLKNRVLLIKHITKYFKYNRCIFRQAR